MVKIRLARFGKRNDPFYRIVAIDEQSKRSGSHVAKLGFWHPRTKQVEIDKSGIKEWVAKGAQITPAVQKLIN